MCSDLDRTLIYSRAAMGAEPHPETVCVEIYDGAPLSFVTPTAATGLAALAERSVFVPTTTRTPEQYLRVHLPGPAPRFAITANGGRLLVDGAVDGDWSAHVAGRLSTAAPLAQVHELLTGAWVLRSQDADGLFCYAIVDRAVLPTAWLAELEAWCDEHGWGVSLQGRKLYCVPRALTKSAAAAEVTHRAGTATMLAAGDSLLDADLLLAADAAIRPAHGELHDAGFTAPHLEVTAAAGVRAGEEIVVWLRNRVSVTDSAVVRP